jgi:2-amino-4-hydroxy-6-hydroxymethyldihydropteridine diphosphokinase
MAEALIGIGGNIGDARLTLDRAVAALCDGSDVHLVARSSDYRTPPWGITDQPAFVNLCLVVATALEPRALLDRAQRIEREFGRDRAKEQRWGPRTLDIDIIAYDDLVLDDLGLTLPHPRLFERAFMLAPLAEIAPDRSIAGMTVAEALQRIGAAGIEKLPPRTLGINTVNF